MMGESPEPLLQVQSIGKSYVGNRALTGVSLSVKSGEVHAVVGANGAGKSTLMSLISGAQEPSEGEIRLLGKPLRFSRPLDAQRHGIATVYQEFSLIPQLSVARNVYLGREPKNRFGLVDSNAMRRDCMALLGHYGFSLSADAEVASLTVAEQQIVEIARALSLDARLFILDEPTAVLSISEQDKLFSVIRQLRAQGLGIVYVSHFLPEVLRIADRVSVLRDGRLVATEDASTLTVDRMVHLMVGKSISRERPSAQLSRPGNGEGFNIRYYSSTGISQLRVDAGEIVGLGGLVGAGRTTMARAICGISKITAHAEIDFGGEYLRMRSAEDAVRKGIIYTTEDRKRDGLFSGLDIVANATASALPGFALGPLRRKSRETAETATIIKSLCLVAASLNDPVARLSGGNQQKVLIGRALLAKPRLLVCDEPTRGVDVGARAEIYRILRDLAASGTAVIVVSSDIEELLAITDRVAIMHDRCIVAEIMTSVADEAAILKAASGGATK